MKYFGTDGIRGVLNEDFDLEFIKKLGKSLSFLNVKEVVIATDTRKTKDIIYQTLASAILSMGINIFYMGVTSTPRLMYYSFKNKILGIMITASHNPYQYNGIKIIDKGFKLSKEKEQIIENSINNSQFIYKKIGKITNIENNEDYYNFISNNIIKTNLKIAFDLANGATYLLAKKIFNNVSNSIAFYADKPDGFNINKGVGSTHIDYLKNIVISNEFDIGFAFDGDGDRVLCVNNDGKIIDGDLIIYIIATYLLSNNKLNKNTVVLSNMSNIGIINSLKEKGINIIETPVGDKYISEELIKNDYSLGGESSGHIIINNFLHFGDGIFTSLYLLKILEETKMSINDFLKNISLYPHEILNIKVKNKDKVLSNSKLISLINSEKRRLLNDCKIIIRKSGTEDYLRLLIMVKTNDELLKIKKTILKIIKEIDR